jgi:protein PhnA
MSIEKELNARSDSSCELCGAKEDIQVYEVPPVSTTSTETCLLACKTCIDQIESPQEADPNHWRCLNDSIWNPIPAVQVISFRMLHQIIKEGWPADLLEMLHMDEETLIWAKVTGIGVDQEEIIKHIDSNGAVLEAGDKVILIKDLNVKGASFVAKRGTVVRNISLVSDNSEHIEGKIKGQHIVILTKFVKKSS